MEHDIAYTILTWCIAVPLMVWQLVPPLAQLFGYFRYTYEVQADTEAFRKEPIPAWLASTSKRLAECGFHPLARVCARIQFDGCHWRKNVTARLYANEGILASVYQTFPLEAPRIAMSSVFSGNAVLETVSANPERKIRELKYWRSGITTNDPQVLLSEHRRRMLGPLEQGAVLVETVDVDVARTATRTEFETVYVQSSVGANAAIHLFMFLVFLFFAAALAYTHRSWLIGGVSVTIACVTPLAMRMLGLSKMTLTSWLTRRRFAEAAKEPSTTEHLIRRERAGS